MKEEEGKMITDWLDKHGNPDIEKQVEQEAANMMEKETLEDAAKNKYPIENTGAMFMPNRHEVSNIFRQEGFIEGAKWQQERSYSEEEVDELVNNLIDKFLNYNGSYVDNEKLKLFYQQFKKK